MNQTILLIIIGILGILVGRKLAVRRKTKQMHGAVLERASARDENMKKLRKYLLSKGGTVPPFVTNNDVERLLGISDATATRYLDALEKEGLVEQVGTEGKGVHYKIL